MAGQLTAEECAALAGIGGSTWRSYVAREQAPAPVGYDPVSGARVWDEAQVRAWLVERPGRSGRPRKVSGS